MQSNTHSIQLKTIHSTCAIFSLLVALGTAAESEGVRLKTPRIHPDKQAYIEAQLERGRSVKAADVLNVFATMSNHPKLQAAWGPFASYILRQSSLPPRDRELVILRIGWLCQAAYEWSHHSLTGLSLGLSRDELARIIEGPDAHGWTEFDRALLQATDELHRDSFISDATWHKLVERYTKHQMMDLVFTAGEYNMVSMALNSFGVQLDKDRSGFPQRKTGAVHRNPDSDSEKQ